MNIIYIEEICNVPYITNFSFIIIGTIIANILFFIFSNKIPIIKFKSKHFKKNEFKWYLKDLTERFLLVFNIYIFLRFLFLFDKFLKFFIIYENYIIVIGIIIFFIWFLIFIRKNKILK